MREIKFRAWDSKYKVMDTGLFWIRNDGKTYDAAHRTYDTPNQEIEATEHFHLMQFTGLHDKNGKEIYEGDLLTSETLHLFEDEDIQNTPCEIAWLNSCCGFVLQQKGRKVALSEYLAGWDPTVFEHFEIIGNIYEQPELLG
jgi:uncharacterized phage protein (TIGR01671 family)